MGVGEGKSGAPEAHVEEKEEDDRVLRHLGPAAGVHPKERDFAQSIPRDSGEDEVEGLQSRYHQPELDDGRVDVGPDGRPVHVIRQSFWGEPASGCRATPGWREPDCAGTRSLHPRRGRARPENPRAPRTRG